MTAEQTSGLAEGTYELRTIVVGEEAALPVITSRAFSTLSLRTAILTEVTNLLSQELATVQDSLDANTGAINDARAAADDAARLANILLVIASVAVVVAVVSLVVLMVVWRRLPKQP
ncbi:MAG: hypothetical protein GTO63_06395 [Anaerolineae bacterium]|nr:hypothetical protein [Anaerolineae bacterium]NIN94602.1 hypothetical protein [Anaerolineae bacterium]